MRICGYKRPPFYNVGCTGIPRNKEKSVIIPSQKIEFLGYVIDSVVMTISLPEKKINKLKEQALSLWEKPQCSI